MESKYVCIVNARTTDDCRSYSACIKVGGKVECIDAFNEFVKVAKDNQRWIDGGKLFGLEYGTLPFSALDVDGKLFNDFCLVDDGNERYVSFTDLEAELCVVCMVLKVVDGIPTNAVG